MKPWSKQFCPTLEHLSWVFKSTRNSSTWYVISFFSWLFINIHSNNSFDSHVECSLPRELPSCLELILRDLFILAVEMYISTAKMEISMEDLKKTENGTTIGSTYTIFCYLSERIKWSQHILEIHAFPCLWQPRLQLPNYGTSLDIS